MAWLDVNIQNVSHSGWHYTVPTSRPAPVFYESKKVSENKFTYSLFNYAKFKFL